MSLTVSKMIADIDCFSKAIIVAGHKGVDKEIRWIHISEHRDFSNWIVSNTLLISSGIILKDEPTIFAENIKNYMGEGLIALVITVGSHIKRIPQVVVDHANTLQFPIIVLPATVPIMEITHKIYKIIISSHYEIIEESLRIHKTLTKAVVDGGNLTDLALLISSLVKRSITIEDPDLKLLAHAKYGKSDELRDRTIDEGKTPEDFVDYLKTSGLLKTIQTNFSPIKIPSIPEFGLIYERVVAPIIVGSQIYGYFWIISGNNNFNDLDFVVIERGATIASLIMSREEAVFRAEQNIISKLFENLIDPHSSDNIYDISKRIRMLGVKDTIQIAIIEHELSEFRSTHQLYLKIQGRLNQEKVLLNIFEKGNRFVCLLQCDECLDFEEVFCRIITNLYETGHLLWVGLSKCSNQTSQLNKRYQEALESLRIARSFSKKSGRVWSFDRLGALRYLLYLPLETHSENMYNELIDSILDYDIKKGTDYFNTLEVYLDNNLNSQATAQALYVHRNTLYQRINKITEKWEIDLTDCLCVLNIHFAIKESYIKKLNIT